MEPAGRGPSATSLYGCAAHTRPWPADGDITINRRPLLSSPQDSAIMPGLLTCPGPSPIQPSQPLMADVPGSCRESMDQRQLWGTHGSPHIGHGLQLCFVNICGSS